MIENEMKWIVSREEWLNFKYQIQKKYGITSGDEIIQKNYYYDTQNFDLHKSKNTLRIRKIDGSYVMQYKHSRQKHNQIACCIEDKFTIDCTPDILCGEFLKYDDLFLLGNMTTKRLRIEPQPGLRIDFDENHYWGMTDYEIEIEFDDIPPVSIMDMCPKPLFKGATTKYGRFLKKLSENILSAYE